MSPHCLFQEWFSYKLERPCQSERQMQIPGPHLPKSSNNYVKRSTLSQVNRKRRAKMQREERVYLKLGRQKAKEKEHPSSPPAKSWGGRAGGEKKRKKGKKKKKNQLQPEKQKLEEVNLPPKIMRACPDPGRGSSPVCNRPRWSSCIGNLDD